MLKAKKLTTEVPGFEINGNEGESQDDIKVKKKKKSSGGFQAMGFSFPILKGITKRGYKLPTPIQRKSIPLALEGKDLVAMARTGSGKTACFVLPILEKLLSCDKGNPGKNLRALILSPTRELALQTLRFVRELGKFTGLTSAAILGGESMEQQFSVMSGSSPDIVVATPGRFLHICVEMNLQLSNIKIVVFDEADRLFELGFGEQLQEIVARLPSSRQTLLFSATLPKMIVEFAKAGLTDPILIRLDVDWKLPSTLWLGWIYVRSELKTAALLMLLENVLATKTPQAVVFVATKHHVEYLTLILQKAGFTTSSAYSGLDPSARKIALGRFTSGRSQVLVVTDVAARGLDLPALDTVINYHFPAKPKLFVHRVGRSARAGRSGRAFSLVAAEDIAHLLDLHLFLGTELINADHMSGPGGLECPSGVWGTLPAGPLEMRHQDVVAWDKNVSEIEEASRICGRGWQQYIRWREAASANNNARAKSVTVPTAPHPALHNLRSTDPQQYIAQIRNYTPRGTILELTAKPDSPMYLAMKAKRLKHGKTVTKKRGINQEPVPIEENIMKSIELEERQHKSTRDDNYIPHQPDDRHTESGMCVNLSTAASSAQLEVGADTHTRPRMAWDRKRKIFSQHDPSGNRKTIRGESGARIPLTYRSGRYQAWRNRNAGHDSLSTNSNSSEFRPHWVKHNERVATQSGKVREPSDKHHIVKERLRKEKLKARLKHKAKGKRKKKK